MCEQGIVYLTWCTYLMGIVPIAGGITLAHLRFLASRLTDDECNKLNAALRSDNFQLSFQHQAALGSKSSKIGATCLDRLIQWKSSIEDEKSVIQENLPHRLLQIGRKDLADWMTTWIFQMLSEDLLTAVERLSGGTLVRRALSNGNPPDVTVPVDRVPWEQHDTLLIVASLGLLLYLIAMSFKALMKAHHYNQWRKTISVSASPK